VKNFVILNSRVRFDGNCSETRPFCGSVCCKNTLVLITEEEAKSGKYEYQEPTPNCNCSACQMMRSTNMRALQRTDNGCIYLDGSGQCSIYEDRRQKCRDFDCPKVWWTLQLPRKSND